RVYQVGDEFYVVEAKGGGGALGTRTVGTEVVQQGTAKYFDDIVANMARSSSKEARQTAAALAKAGPGKVKYLVVRAPIGTKAGQAVLSDVQIGEFVLK